jgi:hypothetical protein
LTKRKDEIVTEAAVTQVYTRKQILQSKKLDHSPDILRVVLKTDEKYSLADVEQRVKEFKERVI